MLYASSVSVRDERPERRFLLYVALLGALGAALVALELADWKSLFSSAVDTAEVVLLLVLLCVIGVTSLHSIRELRRRRLMTIEARKATSQVETLFNMTDMLQSALGHADANSVLRSTASSLLPGCSGALYVFNNSGDRLELSTSWGWPESTSLSDAITPSECWAIKRGKPHINRVDEHALCCDHHQSEMVTMEIPMMARGEIYGLLIMERKVDAAPEQLRVNASVANALADAMSLSLANLALRERLRTQALRDALTGLYNRRYMEDALARCADHATRSESPLSVVMIDLDHFKKLNDEHGHSMGDAVLAEVAAAILGAIRPCDIACRYGGEELVVILPDCALEDAAARAELIRSRIERLSDRHGVSVSASLGISTIPETSNVNDVIADADCALYRAKEEGRNRVIAAPPSARGMTSLPDSKAA